MITHCLCLWSVTQVNDLRVVDRHHPCRLQSNLEAVCWMSFRWCPPVNRAQPGSLSLHRTGPLSPSEHLFCSRRGVETELKRTKTNGQLSAVLSAAGKAWKQKHTLPYSYTNNNHLLFVHFQPAYACSTARLRQSLPWKLHNYRNAPEKQLDDWLATKQYGLAKLWQTPFTYLTILFLKT